MSVYFVGILLIIILWFFLNRYKNGKKIYCVAISIYLFLLAGLRSPSLGINDTQYYYRLYDLISSMSISDVFKYGFSDPGFELFGKLLTYLSREPQLWVFVSSLPLAIGMCKLIYKKSYYPYLSFVLYLSLGYYCYQYTMMRQMMAVGLGVLAYLYYDEKEYKSAAILLALASLMHLTALILLIIPVSDKVKVKKHWKTIAMVGIPLFVITSEVILQRLFTFFSSYRFIRYTSHLSSFNYTLFFIHLIILVASVIMYSFANYKKVMRLEEYETMELYFFCSVLNVMILALINQFALLYRAAAYFGLFEIILLPNSFKNIDNRKLKLLISLSMFVVFTGYLFCNVLQNWNMIPYEFYWDMI